MIPHMRHYRIFDPERADRVPVTIYGVGSIGSHLALALAKTGITAMTIIDFDIVEENNVSTQTYGLPDVGKRKTEALAAMIKAQTDDDITALAHTFGIDESLDKMAIRPGGIHVLAFDNIEARRVVARILQGSRSFLIDARIGGTMGTILTAQANDEPEWKRYLSTLEGKFSSAPCGSQSLWATNAIMGGILASMIMSVINGEVAGKVPLSLTYDSRNFLAKSIVMRREAKK